MVKVRPVTCSVVKVRPVTRSVDKDRPVTCSGDIKVSVLEVCKVTHSEGLKVMELEAIMFKHLAVHVLLIHWQEHHQQEASRSTCGAVAMHLCRRLQRLLMLRTAQKVLLCSNLTVYGC